MKDNCFPIDVLVWKELGYIKLVLIKMHTLQCALKEKAGEDQRSYGNQLFKEIRRKGVFQA